MASRSAAAASEDLWAASATTATCRSSMPNRPIAVRARARCPRCGGAKRAPQMPTTPLRGLRRRRAEPEQGELELLDPCARRRRDGEDADDPLVLQGELRWLREKVDLVQDD